MSKLKRHKPLLILADSTLHKMSTARLLAHYRKSKIVSEFTPNYDDTAPVKGLEEALEYVDKLQVLLNKREHI